MECSLSSKKMQIDESFDIELDQHCPVWAHSKVLTVGQSLQVSQENGVSKVWLQSSKNSSQFNGKQNPNNQSISTSSSGLFELKFTSKNSSTSSSAGFIFVLPLVSFHAVKEFENCLSFSYDISKAFEVFEEYDPEFSFSIENEEMEIENGSKKIQFPKKSGKINLKLKHKADLSNLNTMFKITMKLGNVKSESNEISVSLFRKICNTNQ